METLTNIDVGITSEKTGEIAVYQPDEITKLEVRVNNESVWLTQEQIAILFGVKRPAITKHIRNIFETNELEEISVCSILERTASDGKTYMTQFYNLDMILSVGYRVNSKNAVAFRRWANSVLKEHLLKGFSINQRFSSVEKELKEHRQIIDKHNAQYPPIEINIFSKAHDRFLIIDDTLYLIGASIKDLGKKWCGFVKMENTDVEDFLFLIGK